MFLLQYTCMFISIYLSTHIRQTPGYTIHQNPKRQNHRLRSLWLPMISTSIWEPPVPNVIEAVFILASRLHVFVVRFSGSEELLGFFLFSGYLLRLFLLFFLVWQKTWCQWCHASTKPKYKSNYVDLLATSFFTNSICILLQKIAICHRCVFLSKEFLHPKCAS